MKWRTVAWRRYLERHEDVEKARKESKETFHNLADITLKLVETTERLKAVLTEKGETFDDDA